MRKNCMYVHDIYMYDNTPTPPLRHDIYMYVTPPPHM